MSVTTNSLKEALQPFSQENTGCQMYLEACNSDRFRGEISSIICKPDRLTVVRLNWYVYRIPGRDGAIRWRRGGFWARVRNRSFHFFSSCLSLVIDEIERDERTSMFRLKFVTNRKEEGIFFLPHDPTNLALTSEEIYIPPPYQLGYAA